MKAAFPVLLLVAGLALGAGLAVVLAGHLPWTPSLADRLEAADAQVARLEQTLEEERDRHANVVEALARESPSSARADADGGPTATEARRATARLEKELRLTEEAHAIEIVRLEQALDILREEAQRERIEADALRSAEAGRKARHEELAEEILRLREAAAFYAPEGSVRKHLADVPPFHWVRELESTDLLRQRVALRVLGAQLPLPRPVLTTLAELATEPGPNEIEAARLLVTAGSTAVPPLVGRLERVRDERGVGTLRLLGRLGRDARAALPLLRHLAGGQGALATAARDAVAAIERE